MIAADDLTVLGRHSEMRESFSQGLMGCRRFRSNNLVRLAQLSCLFNCLTLYTAAEGDSPSSATVCCFTRSYCTIFGSQLKGV
jgi:hypothetical protein